MTSLSAYDLVTINQDITFTEFGYLKGLFLMWEKT